MCPYKSTLDYQEVFVQLSHLHHFVIDEQQKNVLMCLNLHLSLFLPYENIP